MNYGVKSNGLLHALRQMAPYAELSVTGERQWHSITFSGVQVCIAMTLSTGKHAANANRLVHDLPEHEFVLNGQMVADIAVIECVTADHQSRLVVDALLLDD